jgi:hypothetical protein
MWSLTGHTCSLLKYYEAKMQNITTYWRYKILERSENFQKQKNKITVYVQYKNMCIIESRISS